MNQKADSQPALSSIADRDAAWLRATPHLRAELKIDLRRQSGRLVAMIEDPVRSRFFQVGKLEYDFLMLLDGKRRIDDVVESMQQRGHNQFNGQAAIRICQWLSAMNLLDTPGASHSSRLCSAAHARHKQQRMNLLNPVSFRINLLNPDYTLKRLEPFAGWLFTTWMLLVWLVLGVVAVTIVQADYERFCQAAVGILAADRWLWLLLVWITLKVIHEAAHGVACRKYGGEVRQAGVLILLLAPLAYVNVTSAWRFSSRRQRLIVSAAGMYVELLVAFLAVIVWYYTESRWLSDLCYNIVIMAGISTVLFNANPLLRFDGYYLLADLLGIVNLYGKGQAWMGDRVRHLIFGFPKDANVCAPSELRLVALYGVSSFVWRVVVCISLLLVASTLLGGAGLVMAMIGGFFWVWMPVAQFVRKVRQTAIAHPVNRVRLALVTTAVTGLVVISTAGLQAPAVTRAPAIVQFKDEQLIRAAADGFIRDIRVQDGQAVKAGTLLVRIENPDLVHELEELRQSLEVVGTQARIYRQSGEISLQQAELAKADSLSEQIEEMRVRVNRLDIVAPFDGVVYQRDLANMDGRFVKQGEAILHFADPQRKQILTSIDQQQIRTVRSRQHLPVRFAFSGVPLLTARLQSIEPRASDRPIDPAITAAAGGVLPVRHVPAEDNSGEGSPLRLVHPRFTGKCELADDWSSRLEAGQRGMAFLRGRDLSLGAYCVLKCREWIRNKLRAATGGIAGASGP
jgi:putative peptide zinc metalloprotease protein